MLYDEKKKKKAIKTLKKQGGEKTIACRHLSKADILIKHAIPTGREIGHKIFLMHVIYFARQDL